MATNRLEFSENGKATRAKATTTPKPGAGRPTKAEKDAKVRHAKLRRRLAGVVGGTASGVLALSVVHCTEAIGALTGSAWYLAAPLAIGIDMGMIAAELAELVAGDDRQLRRWAMGYVVLAVLLSMGLNAYAFASHCPAGLGWAGVLLGVIVPSLVFILGRVAGLLAKGGDQ